MALRIRLLEVALRVALGARALAQHVVAEAQARLRRGAGRRPRPCASSMVWPSTNWRPSNWIARTVAATTVCAPRRASRPGVAFALGQEALRQRDRAGRQAAPARGAGCRSAHRSKSARPSWSAVSAIAVSASGTRSSASASRISARPSALEIGYSRSSDSIAQNGAGASRTACDPGPRAAATHRRPVEVAPTSRAAASRDTDLRSRHG